MDPTERVGEPWFIKPTRGLDGRTGLRSSCEGRKTGLSINEIPSVGGGVPDGENWSDGWMGVSDSRGERKRNAGVWWIGVRERGSGDGGAGLAGRGVSAAACSRASEMLEIGVGGGEGVGKGLASLKKGSGKGEAAEGVRSGCDVEGALEASEGRGRLRLSAQSCSCVFFASTDSARQASSAMKVAASTTAIAMSVVEKEGKVLWGGWGRLRGGGAVGVGGAWVGSVEGLGDRLLCCWACTSVVVVAVEGGVAVESMVEARDPLGEDSSLGICTGNGTATVAAGALAGCDRSTISISSGSCISAAVVVPDAEGDVVSGRVLAVARSVMDSSVGEAGMADACIATAAMGPGVSEDLLLVISMLTSCSGS